MKHTIWKRTAACVLAVITLAGCQSTPAPSGDSTAEKNVAMGRYIEAEYTVPDGVGYTKFIGRMPDGTLELFCNLDDTKNVGPWKIYTSSDDGKRWTEKSVPWLAEFENAAPSYVHCDKAGSWYIHSREIPPEIIEMVQKGIQPPADFEAFERFTKIDTVGVMTEFPTELPRGSSSAGSQSVQVAENGDFLIDDFGSILQVDPATMQIKHEYMSVNKSYRMPYITYENTLVISDGEEIIYYDLMTFEQTASISMTPEVKSDRRISVDNDRRVSRAFALGCDNALYISDRTGIYRHVEGGSVLEKLVDGEMTSLNMPSLEITDMVVSEEDEITVFFAARDVIADAQSLVALHYAYSDSTPTVPVKELKLYSLMDNKTVRQAMGLFQRANPDIHVIYEVGLSSGSITTSDALRTLSAELLAGKGPDLLVLDGMPIDSYIEKGVLLDLSQTIDAKIAGDELLENPASSFKQAGGKIYAVPARFTATLIAGAEDAMTSVTDLTTLADYLVKEKERNGEKYDMMLEDAGLYALIELFYPISAPVWQNEDGTIKEDVFRQFLTDLKKLYDLEEHEGDSINEYSGMGLSGALMWAHELAPVVIGNVNTIRDIAIPDAAITKRGGGTLKTLDGQAQSVFIPKTVLGVNANGNMQDAAKGFVELMLSEQVQRNDFEDGMPVSTAAFSEQLKNPYPSFDDGITWGCNDKNGEMIMLQVKWPTDAFMQKITADLTGLNVPFVPDQVVADMLFEETKLYFTGELTLDDVVKAFTQKLNLYLSE